MGKYLDSIGLSHFMGLIKQALAGKSDTGHTHAAGDITSGVLPLANGGTGVDGTNSGLAARRFLASGATAVSPMPISFRGIVVGDLPTGNTADSVALGSHTHSDYLNTSTTQTANKVYAGPSSGNAAAPTFRSLVAADIPSLAISKITNLQTTLDGKQASGNYWVANKDGTSYWGLHFPDDTSNGWVRTPQSGIIPYASGGGSSSLGTSGWPFTNVYSTNIYLNGTALKKPPAYYSASSATQVNVTDTSLFRFLVILFRTNSSTYTGNGTSAATSPLNSTIVHINNKSSGTVYASLEGGHKMSGTSIQIRQGLATITCSATAGKVVLSNQMYCNLGNGSSGTQEVGADTSMALVGVIGIY